MSRGGPSGALAPAAGRAERLRERLAEAGLEGLLVTHGPNVRYLSGFTGSSGLLLLREEAGWLLTDSRYEEQAAEECGPGIEVHVTRNGLWSSLGELGRDWAGEPRVGFEAEHLTVRERARLEEELPGVAWEGTQGLVEALRAVKEPAEIERIARAGELACAALSDTLPVIREGMTELEIAAELEYRLRRAGSEGPAFDSIVAVGPRSALPHARPSDRALRSGDLLLVDFGGVVEGYRSDITRTFVAGPAAGWQTEIHDVVREAHDLAVAAVASGVPGRAVDAAARDRIRAAGYDERFGHSTGHGLGLEVHEAPAISHRADRVLQAGNVVTIEPGVYLPGRGGVRLEDDVAVESAQARVLTSLPLALREL